MAPRQIKLLNGLLFSCAIALFCSSCNKQNTWQLNGTWQFRIANSNDNWLNANVPGNVHTDLFANGSIPDPYIGCNHKQLGWIDTLDWEYRRTFMLPKKFNPKAPIYIVFEGIDTYADVFINDSLLLSSDNMFRSWKADCSRHVKSGENTIRVVFSSAAAMAKRKSNELGFKLPDGEWAHLRKAPYHFGWDWGPRFVTCGIWKPVYLQQNNVIYVENHAITTVSIDSVKALMSIDFDYTPVISGKYNVKVINQNLKTTLFDSTFSATTCKSEFKGFFSIKSPKIWWPNGHGSQNLYNLSIEISTNNRIAFRTNQRVGIRTVQLVNEVDSIGESFYFVVNGKPMFAKGANIIPPHSFIPLVTDSAWTALVKNAKRSNFNMVRVWGGGVYPPDIFFEACNEKGILVWQDFMFACSMYPWDSAFTSSVRAEAEQQVKRIRKHTSLAIWCGNNEVSEGWHNWGWQKGLDSNKLNPIWEGYRNLFEITLDSIVKKHDNTRGYWASSPKYGWGRNESMTHGDSHYWGVWWGIEPFSKFRTKIPRFMSEYGMQGAPSIETIKLFSSNHQMPDSTEMQCHQKHSIGYETIKTYMVMEGFYPKSLTDWIYGSQVTQAIALKTAIESQRLASPRCMGTLYWQMNDCWPVVSWAGIDYLGYWKASQYTIADCYRTILAGATASNGEITVRAISDSLNPVSALASVKVISPLGKTIFSNNYSITLEPNISVEIASICANKYSINPTECVVQTEISTNLGKNFESISFLGKIPDAQVQNPQIYVQNQISENGGTLILSTQYPAYFVQITSNNPKCSFEQNYFHLLPGKELKVRYSGVIGDDFVIRSVKQ